MRRALHTLCRLTLGLSLGGALLIAGCNRDAASAASNAGGAPKAPPVPVTVGKVSQRDMPDDILGIGNVESIATVMLRPQVDAQLMEANFTEGQDVRKGDVLFTLDKRPFEAVLAAAVAQLAKDTAMAQDAQRAAEQMGEAGRAVSERESDKARADADAARAQVETDKALIDTAKLRLEYCTIRSPIDGRTGASLAKPGNIVKEMETDLVQINQIAPIYVAFSVPETFLARINQAQAQNPLAVLTTIPGSPGGPVTGQLAFVDNKVDSTTGTVRLKALYDNADRRLWPGQFVNVSLTLNIDRQALVVPAAAIQKGQKGQHVYVVKPDRTVDLRVVKVIRSIDDFSVIGADSGLTAGDTVVTDGQLRLAPGLSVEVMTPGAATPAASSAGAKAESR